MAAIPCLATSTEAAATSAGGEREGGGGGVRRRLKAVAATVPLPSIILANVRSFGRKLGNYTLDELHASVTFLSEYRDACMLCFTETWWCPDTQLYSTELEGFGVPYRLDRDSGVTHKERGGGVAIYVNERWCKKSNVIVRVSVCTSDVEMLALSMRPVYLPRELGQLVYVVVYVHPNANSARAAEEITECVDRLRSATRDAPIFILGDFNDCDLHTTMPSLSQYVTCTTRKNKTLDKCYGTIASAYRSIKKAPLGTSDHDTVLLLPCYEKKLRRETVQKKKIKVWDSESVERLRGCFACTDWSVLTEGVNDVSEVADIVADYVNFCEDMIIPEKIIKLYPNNKPWITKKLKSKIVEKNKLFAVKKLVEGKALQKEIKRLIREEKVRYKERVEGKLCSGDVRDAWRGIKTMAGKEEVREKDDGMNDEERKDFVERLNTFYCRFDCHDFSQEKKEACDVVATKLHDHVVPQIEEEVVEKTFSRISVNKAQGPDAISGRVIKLCSQELAPVYCNIFNMSLQSHSVPRGWKAATICPVPKKAKPTTLNDYRPIALTSVVMKCLEHFLLSLLKQGTHTALDPHQFAYRSNRAVEDAVLSLVQYCQAHIEQGGSLARILYVDFSSAFNTVQTHLLVQKLEAMNLNPHLTLWVADFLSERTQTVCVRSPAYGPPPPLPPSSFSTDAALAVSSSLSSCSSSVKTINTGTPQGTVISPFVFTLYTDDCRSDREDLRIIKFSDDTALVDTSDSAANYEESISTFAQWCDQNCLELNVTKTKEMVIDYKRNVTDVAALQLKGQVVERVEEYKYLGTIVDHKLNFSRNAEVVYKKCRQRMYILYQLRSFKVSSHIIEMCYHAFIESILTFSFICWFKGLNVKSKNQLCGIESVCSKIVGKKQATLEQLFHKRALSKAVRIQRDPTHPLSCLFELLPSNRRFRCALMRTQRYKNTFIPTAISMLNEANARPSNTRLS